METRVVNAIEALLGGEVPRVWSLIVTIFGDMAQGEGAALSGAVLTRLTGAVGVKPEAMRVALHRLRRDGWIESERAGRASLYRLSESGRHRSAAVTPRIYAAQGPEETQWHLLVAGEPARRDLLAESDTGVALGGGVVLGTGPVPEVPGDVLGVSGQVAGLPDWVRARVCPEPLVDQSRALAQRFAAAEAALGAHAPEDPVARAVLRMLVVHGWRRLLLRAPELPDRAFPARWQGPVCRAAVGRLLARAPLPSPDALEAAVQNSA